MSKPKESKGGGAMKTLRCIAFVPGVGRCILSPVSGEVLCPTHCAQRDEAEREYEVCIFPMSEFISEDGDE
jgi:hypothetical protein